MALIHLFSSPSVKKSLCVGLLLVLTLFFFLYGLGSYGLLNNNEGLYGHIAKDMAFLLSKDFSLHKWVVPHINGFPYIEKPPLLYWLTALSFKIFGVNEFAARLAPALSGVCLVAGSYVFFYRLTKPTFMLPSLLILLSSLGFVIFSRMVFFEGLLTSLCTLSLLSFYLWYTQEKRIDLYLTYLFLGLSCLTKGFAPPCLVGMVILSFFALEKTPWKKIFRFFNPVALGLFCLIVLPWILCAGFYEKEFFWFFIINEHVLRFMGQRLPKDYYSGPLYYYIPRILGYIFPWTFFLGVFFLKTKPQSPTTKSLQRFLVLWFFIPLVFYSVSQAKANYYMIIGIFPLATLIGIKLSSTVSENRWGYISALKILTILVTFSLLLTPQFITVPYVQFSPNIFLWAAGITLAFEACSRCWISIRFYAMLLQITCLSGILLIWILQTMGSLHLNALISSKSLSQQISTYGPRPVVLYRNYEELSALPFYLSSSFYMVDSQSADLDFARTHPHSVKKFLTSEVLGTPLVPHAQTTLSPLLVVHPKSLSAFQSSPLATQSELFIEQNGVCVFKVDVNTIRN